MKKITLFIFAILFISLNTFSQIQHIVVGKNYVTPNEVTLVAERGVSTTIKFDLNELDLIEIATDYGKANIMMSAKAPVMLCEGAPDLIYLPTAIIIPDVGAAELDISYGTFTEIENIEIAPSKGNLSRSIDPETIPYVKGEVYSINDFFPGNLAKINETFIMRDVRGLSLFVYPVQYNPVTKTLRIYSEITITVNNTENEGENEFTTQKRHETIDPTFAQMYENMFLNYNNLTRGFPTGEEGELLIICAPTFMDEMQPYIDWKRTIGRKTTIVSTAEISPLTPANIQLFIKNYYNTAGNNLSFVLLVGGSALIPPVGTSNPRSDIKYGQINSGNYLDVLIGRFSATTNAHVKTQVNKSLQYERDLNTTDTWITKGIGLAANEGSGGGHDGGEADYVHMNNIRNRMLTYGYTTVYQEYAGVGSGTNNASISARFNSGVSIANYCNHGSPTAWTFNPSPTYSNTEVNALTNANQLPFIFSVACNNGEFGSWQYNSGGAVCFAETWLRAIKGEQLTGAVAFLGATISISWLPPMTAQDAFSNIILDLPVYTGTQPGIKRTISGAMLNATQKMIMIHGNSSLNDYHSWLVFGDPTLMFRTKTPQEMVVNHLPNLSPGTNQFSVECDVVGANATISYKNENNEVIILGTALVNDGTANITFTEPIADQTEFTLAVTGFNKVTYVTTLDATPPVLYAPEKLTHIIEKANNVILNWDAPEGKGLTLKGYNMFRDDEKINEKLVEETTFTDIVPANGEYKYEVTAVYGTMLESDPCEPEIVSINGMCIPISSDITVTQIEGVNILISWDAPQYEGTELVGYNIYKGDEQLNTEIIPATSLNYFDEIEPEIEVCYHIEVIYNDCEESLKTEKKCITLVSIKDLHEEQSITVYPNPTSGEFIITNYELRITCIEMYDVFGKKQTISNLKSQISKSEIEINISHLTCGIYFLKIDTVQGSVMKKLVKN
ncbi:MAG: C25 family cysteine peptidase [Bacteroidales bacterium]|jgi:gingipain R|nr:C25 family cysteine peptidase [Bacteroidales bacterium]